MPVQSPLITTPSAASVPDDQVCPKCQTRNESVALARRQYRCAGCGLELAHLDMAANGAVRGGFGWVLDRGVVVHESYQIVAVLGKGGFGVTYLVNDILNELNIGLMVKGNAYNPVKRQYWVQSLRQRQEATRSVIVLDASKSMAEKPFQASIEAAIRFIEGKRPQGEVAVLAVRDGKTGDDLVSQFERDGRALTRRIADIKADGLRTRLYDSIGAALQMCAMSAQGSVVQGVYVVSCSVLVFSDGRDEGSAVSREELMTRISGLSIPIPIYSLAYSKESPTYFKNLAALSKNSFGIYYHVGETMDRMTRIVEEIQNVLQSDYVLTFRSAVPADGDQQNFKLGLEYPSGSGKFVFDAGTFAAIELPPIPAVQEQVANLNEKMPPTGRQSLVQSGGNSWDIDAVPGPHVPGRNLPERTGFQAIEMVGTRLEYSALPEGSAWPGAC